jgi:hypothetical protein
MRNAVLFLVFNRPETTLQVFDAIRAARPPRLYVAADGPRANRAGEAERCAEARRIATSVDWPCEVHTLFRERNLGCKIGVSSGISWFFDKEEQGIILEDDVLPVPTFFGYCDELLERYRHDERVAMISGCNLIAGRFIPDESYFFSHYNHIWGWAGWRRAWRHYDVQMKGWSAWLKEGGLRRLSNGSRLFEAYWRLVMANAISGNTDTWDYQWTFACWRSGGLSVLPGRNQTRNLGFGSDATNTAEAPPSYIAESPPLPLHFPLIHPRQVVRLAKGDALIDEHVFKISRLKIAQLYRARCLKIVERRLLAHPIANALLKPLRKHRGGSEG